MSFQADYESILPKNGKHSVILVLLAPPSPVLLRMIRHFYRTRVLSALSTLMPCTTSYRFQVTKTGKPFVCNKEAMEKWKQNLTKVPQKSPFAVQSIPTKTSYETIMNCLEKHSRTQPHVPAMIDLTHNKRQISYAGMILKSNSLSGFLESRGLSLMDKVSITMTNRFQWPVSLLGVWGAGGTIVATSALYTPYEMQKQYSHSQCSVVITCEALLDKVLEAAKDCPLIKTVICARSTDKPLPEGVIDFAEAIAHPPIKEPVKSNLNDPCLILYSSGTTGEPKGAVLSHLAVNSNVAQLPNHYTNEVYPLLGLSTFEWDKEYQLMNLPFYHSFGLGLLQWFFDCGSPMLIMEKFDPLVYLSAIQEYKIRIVFVVPPILLFLSKHTVVCSFDLSSIQIAVCGAAPAGEDLSKKFVERFPNVRYIFQGYGMTEIGFSHMPLLHKQIDASVGLVAPLCQQKIVDINGNQVGIGERGEICIRGPTLMTEYLNDPKATAETIDKDGWFHTGDLAYMDECGLVYIVDRLKELIKVKALQVAPAEIEDVLLSHSDIVDCAIVGVPDDNVGELVRAFVVRRDKTVTSDLVRQYVAEKLSDYKHITGGVKFIKEIPKSPAGKILRRTLRDYAKGNEDEEERA